jgi:hypothetical protein
MLNSLSNRIIQFQKFSQSSLVIQNVEHLVDGGGLAHQEEPFITRSCFEDIDSFERHLRQSRLIDRGPVPERRLGDVGQVLREDLPIDPLGHITLRKQTKRPLVRVSRGQLVLVIDDLVPRVLEGFVVILTRSRRSRTGQELFSSSSEEDVGTFPLSPAGVVGGNTMQVLNGKRVVGVSLTGGSMEMVL